MSIEKARYISRATTKIIKHGEASAGISVGGGYKVGSIHLTFWCCNE